MRDLPVLITIHEPFVLYSLPCPAWEESDRVGLVGTWCPARINPPHVTSYIAMFCSSVEVKQRIEPVLKTV